MSTTNAVELPTEDDYHAVQDTVQDAHDALEALACRLGDIDETMNLPSRLATAGDVGLLWSFLEGLRLQMSDMQEYAKRLEFALSGIDVARMEGFVAEGGENAR
jgi:hypothetical protein